MLTSHGRVSFLMMDNCLTVIAISYIAGVVETIFK